MKLLSSLKKSISALVLAGGLLVGGSSAAQAAISLEFIVYNNIAGYNINLVSYGCTDGVTISPGTSIAPGNYSQFTASSATALSTLCNVRYSLTVGGDTYGCQFTISAVEVIPGFTNASAYASTGGSPTCYVYDQDVRAGHTGGFFVMEP